MSKFTTEQGPELLSSFRGGSRVFTPNELIAFHKEHFGDARMEDDPTAPVAPAAPVPTPPQRGPGSDGNKPVAEMNADEKADFFSKKADRLAGILKGFGDVTPDKLAELVEKAGKHDALEHELMSDREKALADARRDVESETTSKFLPKLVAAEFRAASAGRVAADKLEAALEFADMGKFVKAGEVDAEKVARFVESLAPTTTAPAATKGPSSYGLGATKPSGGAPGDQGKAQAEKRYGTKP